MQTVCFDFSRLLRLKHDVYGKYFRAATGLDGRYPKAGFCCAAVSIFKSYQMGHGDDSWLAAFAQVKLNVWKTYNIHYTICSIGKPN